MVYYAVRQGPLGRDLHRQDGEVQAREGPLGSAPTQAPTGRQPVRVLARYPRRTLGSDPSERKVARQFGARLCRHAGNAAERDGRG